MTHKTLIATLAAASLAFGGLAMAKGNDDKHGRGHGHKKADKHHRQGPPPHAQAGGRGAGPDHNFYRGGRLPVQYRDRGYWVDDWRGHRLSAPPPGYHWVQTGGDYVLVANNTGIIFQIYLGQ
ncbi:RcnB family protein [Polaromonas sp. LjRoot131]|uniref:RcnB family protein n=1 Tax=Polaromonas sp. LjRoot131 TaxID=3342262 RepID=UPI003ECC5D47